MADFIFLSSAITVDGDCSHEIERCFLLRRKAMKNLDSILKSKDITLPTNVCVVKAMVFPVVMYGCGSWTIKKMGHQRVEHQRTDAFKLWMLEKMLESPLDWREINPVNLKGNQPWFSLEGLMLKVWPVDVKSWLIGKNLYAGKDWKQKEKGATEDETGE